MHLLLQLLVIILAFISLEHVAITGFAQPYTYVVAPINKHTDAAKPLYSVEVITTWPAKFIIDIDAPFIWHSCTIMWNRFLTTCPSNLICTSPVSCIDYHCEEVRTTYSYNNPSCSGDLDEFCVCPVHIVDPVTGSCGQAHLSYDSMEMYTSGGRKVGANLNAGCVPPSTFASYPANVTGVMALSFSRYALPAYYKNTLALCIPSKPTAHGVMFLGSGPYYLLPQSKVDVRSYLSYTPLLKRQDSHGYFISVNSIVIKKRSINIPANTTTKLSTIDPYTILRTDIYNGVVRRFSKVTKRIPLAKPVAPFGLCFNTSNTTGLKVPDIDFILLDGKKWTISTSNSIKQITDKVACLAFVDGGASSEPAIVIGAFQFEDNFLVFDLENSTFGFSSSLLRKKTSCANYNFTFINHP